VNFCRHQGFSDGLAKEFRVRTGVETRSM